MFFIKRLDALAPARLANVLGIAELTVSMCVCVCVAERGGGIIIVLIPKGRCHDV